MTDQPVQNSPRLPELVKVINGELAAALKSHGDEAPALENKEEREEIGRHICIEEAGKQLAIPLSAVLEAGELQLVQSLPLLPDWISGITNIRGEIVSVVNLALFLDWKKKSSEENRSFLIVHDETIKIAVTVDRVIGTRSLYRLPIELLQQPEETASPSAFFSGTGRYEEQSSEKAIPLFDLKRFLSSEKLRNIANA